MSSSTDQNDSGRPGPVGARVSVRVRVGERTRDLLGVLESANSVRRRDGSLVEFDPADLVAWKQVPAPQRVRLRLYDTARREVCEVRGHHPGRLTIYACGPTVYRYAHVGNLRTFTLTDVIRRTAELAGLTVHLVQNITDVGHMADDAEIQDPLDTEGGRGEDKVLAQARDEGKDPFAIARFYENAFHRDLAALNIRPADAYPRASESIEMMIDLIAQLMDRGHAYIGADGSVFFDARSFASYGQISGNRLDALRPGHRFEGAIDTNKRFHADWALWKRSDREMTWPSPWGAGFPGWHIECSAMSLALLGPSIDLHTGGIDLRFPHHEDERAQSNAATGAEVVRHWVHGEHLLFEGRKMAKSTGNVVLLQDLIDRGLDPLALRLVFLENRYRTQMDLSWDSLEAAHATLTRWRRKVARWAEQPSDATDAMSAAVEALQDDLDTPRAVQVLRRIERDDDLTDGAKFECFAYLDRVFALDLTRDIGAVSDSLPDEAAGLLDQRARARAERDFARSDALRDQLAALGVIVRDTPKGQEWELA